MTISQSLLKQFAKLTNDSPSSNTSNSTIRGIAVVDGTGRKYVRLDGSSMLTPVSEATDIQNGDRVLVSIENHTATVVGNFTAPPSARTASKYLNLTDDGLLVGELNESGTPKGTASLIAPGTYYVVDEDGNALASFAEGSIDLGTLDAIVRFCGGKCRIYSSDGVMVLYGANAVGMRSSYSENTAYRSEVVCQANSKSPIASLQAYHTSDTDPCRVSVSREGIALIGPTATYKGSEILRSNHLLCSGLITATGAINAGKAATIQATVNIPTGFYLAGIREIKSNYNTACVIAGFYTHPSTNVVAVRLKNTGTTNLTDVEVGIEWFGLYCKGSTYTEDSFVTFTEDE